MAEYYFIMPSESTSSRHLVVRVVSSLKFTRNYYYTTLYLTVYVTGTINPDFCLINP